jgi:hypothetical protein
MSRRRRPQLPLTVIGWAGFAFAAMAGWVTLALAMFGLLIPVTFSAMIGDHIDPSNSRA